MKRSFLKVGNMKSYFLCLRRFNHFYIYMINIARNLEWNPKMDTQKHPYLTPKKQEFTNCIKGKKNIGFMNEADISLPNYNQLRLPEDKVNDIFKKSGKNLVVLRSNRGIIKAN